MRIANWLGYIEWILFAAIVLAVYFAYKRGVRRAVDQNKVQPSGLFDYIANLRYYRREPQEEGYREYRRFNLIASKTSDNERQRNWYDQENDREDDYEDWDEEDEDWDVEEDEEEDEDWDDDEDDEEDWDDDEDNWDD